MLVRREADESAESSVRDFEEILQYGKAFLPPWQATEATRFEEESAAWAAAKAPKGKAGAKPAKPAKVAKEAEEEEEAAAEEEAEDDE